MSSSTIRGRSGGGGLTIRNIIYNGGIVNKCVCGNNVRMRE